MRFRVRKNSIYFSIILFLLMFIGIGYSYLNSNLNISANTTIAKNVWDIHFANLSVGPGSITPDTEIVLDGTSTSVNFAVTLQEPGDYYEFYLDVVNAGTISAMLSQFTVTELSEEYATYVDFIVQYSDGKEITVGDSLVKGTNDTIYVKIGYKADVDIVLNENQYLNLAIDFTYVQDDGTSVARPQKVIQLMASKAQSDAGIAFNAISSTSNGEGVYVRSGTENNSNPIYYYRGNVADNNLKFAGFCWKIVRTTETGGVKLIYNGIPSTEDGSCNNTGTASEIGKGQFNSSYDSPAYVGYMYGTVYKRLTKAAADITAGMVFGNSVEYNDGKYTLLDTYTSENGWATDYKAIGEKYHYTCFSTESSCETVNYIFYAGSADTAYYFPLTEGKTQLNLLDEMLTNSTNENSSTIKGIIDSWYSTNMANYTVKLEDTVWCNDRSINQLNGWDKDKNATSYLNFGGYGRLVGGSSPSLECTNPNDKFTVNSANGNGKLTYPAALLTADELVLAGAKWNTAHSNFYLYTGESWWALSPDRFNFNHASAFYLYSSGHLLYSHVHNSLGVRPSVSLRPGTSIAGGDGSTANPYTVN